MNDLELRFRHRVPVRFRDIDLGGHAHHSVALMYFEEARAAYWRDVVGRPRLEDIDYILAEATVRYRQRVLYPDLLDVGVGVVRLGKKHFEMAYEVRSSSGEVLVTGRSIQVMYDYAAGRSTRMSDEMRARIEAFEGAGLEGADADRPGAP